MIDNKRKKKRKLVVRKYSNLVLIGSISKLCSWSLCALAIAPCLSPKKVPVCSQNCLYFPLLPQTVNKRDG